MASLEKLNLKKKTKKSYKIPFEFRFMPYAILCPRSCVRKTNIKSNILWFGTDRRKTNLKVHLFLQRLVRFAKNLIETT